MEETHIVLRRVHNESGIEGDVFLMRRFFSPVDKFGRYSSAHCVEDYCDVESEHELITS
jgi:hypothetical protein